MESIIKGKCIDYTYDGKGVIKVDNEVIFVDNVLINEEVEVRIRKKEKNYSIGEVVNYITTSKERKEPSCPYFYDCGGCHLLHMSYIEQLRFKENHVQNCIQRIGGIDKKVLPIIGMDKPYKYRNKVQVSFSKDYKGQVIGGFYKEKTHQIIDNERCLLENEIAEEIITFFKKLIVKYDIEPFDRSSNYGTIRHLLVRTGYYPKEVMVVIITKSKYLPKQKELIKELTSKFPNIKSIIHNINEGKTNHILGNIEKCIYGKDYIEDTLCGLKFKISSKSFYQVNPTQTERLYMEAINAAKLTKEDNIIDAYSGIGTIGLIASKYVHSVVGVEIVKEAIINAQNNLKINNITNAKYYVDDASRFMMNYIKDNKADVVFVDPPRNGLEKKFVEALLTSKPPKVIYISCDPSSLSRDLKMLKEVYEIESIQPVDMFPNTYHVETVVLLSHKDSNKHINVKVDFDTQEGKQFLDEIIENVNSRKPVERASYPEIKEYILNKYNVKVSTLNIAQIKAKYGIIERECYNKPKNENPRQPKCTKEKEELIVDALKHFEMI